MMERTGTAELPKIRWILLRLALVCTAGVFAARRVESSAIVMAACSGKVEQHTERRGVIYSPSWPLNYPAGMNCSWNIQGDKGDVITISFRNFDLEESGKCAGDWLLLGPTWREEYRVCGSLIPPPFISTRGHVWLHFHSTSTSSGQAQGFRLSYIRGQLGRSSCQGDEFLCGNGKCLPGSWRCNGMDECGDATDERSCAPPPTEAPPSLCPPGTFQCTQAQSTRCLPNTLRCNSARDCADGADEDNCPDTSCGKRLGNFYGSFASPDFFRPSRSPAELRCSWLVDTQDRKHILLQLDLQLGSGDYVRVYDGLGEHSDRLLQALSYHSNHRPVLLESSQGQLTVLYHAKPRGGGHGFNATYQVKGYCFPGERPCGSDQGCFSERQRCDGYWHCPSGKDEEGCQACQPGEYPCEGGSGACYPAAERCNNQKRCPDGSDEKNCHACQPGNFHCGTNLCIFETWRCDGQEDCQDGSDERDCLVAVPRKVITAALIGSLVCGLLLVVALGCAFKLYSLRAREYRAFETQMTRLEAEFVRREAPPSYGQLIAQGLIPPVEDFPVYNPSQASVLQNIRTAMRRQIRRHSSRRAASRRRLGRIWSRLFHRGTRLRGQIPLLTPPGAPHLPLGGGAHSYQAVAGSERHAPSPCSPLASEEPTGGLRRPTAGSPASEDLEGGACSRCRGPGSPPAPGEAERGLCPRKVSRRLVQGLAANLRGVSVRHYSSLDPPPPAQLRAEPPPAGPSGCRSVEVPILEDAGALGGGRQPSSDEDDDDDDESLLIC